ncbi:MAG: PepSY domain-containing protein [Methylococcales bacterium]|nr:MAG: PepSY domain-containing protein [Methylococcales bacterium]
MSIIEPQSEPSDFTIEKATNLIALSNKIKSFINKITLRKIFLKIHLYISLWLGAFLVIAGLTGSILVYEHTLDKFFNSESMLIEHPGNQSKSIAELINSANLQSPIKGATSHIQLPTSPDEALIIRYQMPAEGNHKGHNHHFYELMLNQYTGEVIGQRDQFTSLMGLVLRLHFNLFADETGQLIMGITSLLTLLLIMTGIYVWWPKLKHLKAAFIIKRNASPTRFNFDLHKTVGIYTALILFSVSLSGVHFNMPYLFRPIVNYFSPVDNMRAAVVSEKVMDVSISTETAINIAEQIFPGIEVKRVSFPANKTGVYMVMGKQIDEMSDKGTTILWVDQYSGKVLKVKDPHQLSPGNAFLNIQLPLHNGEILGEPGRVLVLIAGFAPLLLMITGVIHWLKKRRSKRLHDARFKTL